MSALTDPVHFPAKPDRFEFDAEVSKIFPNMAARSIPNYHLFHATHAAVVADWFTGSKAISLLDVGASHAGFFTALKEHYADHPELVRPTLYLHAIDNSPQMCAIMRDKHPDVHVMEGSLTDQPFMQWLKGSMQFDVVNATYLLQFIEPSLQLRALQTLCDMVRPGGLLILGQKEKHSGALGHALHERYIAWRMANGYSRAEIEAKTKALAGSMWPMEHEHLLAHLKVNFREVRETSRLFMFSTLIACK